MTTWKPLGEEQLLADGQMTEVEVDGTRILLCRVEGSYYALQPFCSHMGGKFKNGSLEGFVVSCPRNASRFDVRDGSVVEWLGRMPGLMRKVVQEIQHPKALRTYPTRVEQGQLWIALEETDGEG
jgi:3-phenylpropionate/trans-cinnamate dioxygenase ferredoxin subunit